MKMFTLDKNPIYNAAIIINSGVALIMASVLISNKYIIYAPIEIIGIVIFILGIMWLPLQFFMFVCNYFKSKFGDNK
ncbi:MAG: hypothetical protein WC648_04995 [Candidatus Paceibacterota bacterium]|jgi:hypothetical protein